MEPSVFLIPQQNHLRVASWNINGVRTKLEKPYVYSILVNYDLIGLYEIKTDMHVSFPGYTSYISRDNNNSHRGGTCVLVKQGLSGDVMELDVSIPDQVWFMLRCVPGVLFGFCYVPPPDSPFYNHALLSSVQEKIKTSHASYGCVVAGDMNARFGEAVCELPGRLRLEQCSYPTIPDRVQCNDNASALLGVCIEEELLVVNNLCCFENMYTSKLTYRQGCVWVSEIDSCLMSASIIRYLCGFNVNQDLRLPSDHALVSWEMRVPDVNLDALVTRASWLGDHTVLHNRQTCNLVRPPIKFITVDPEKFVNVLSQQYQPILSGDTETCVRDVCSVLYQCARGSRVRCNHSEYDDSVSRWERLVEEGDDGRLWRAINWRGELSGGEDVGGVRLTPTDGEFKDHFESLYNPPDEGVPSVNVLHGDVYMPVLDDPIMQEEVSVQVRRLRGNKACGPDGVPPGVFKLLPPVWILTLAVLFNNVFMSASYPVSWATSKLVTVFKKGSRAAVTNYRGISVMDSMAKLYDMVLSARLARWFIPDREQAGSQAGRGCIEHVVTLRLLCDIARRKKFKLFVTFIDFTQAYDRVPRGVLFEVLKRLGCGATMLVALVAMYRITHSVLGSAVISATIGVRQGSPTSCLLFVIFVNDLIKLIKHNCNVDGFLAWLHILVLMDDTVLLSTSRRNMVHKLRLLNEFCMSHGMKINETKTRFFVINGNDEDKVTMHAGEVSVNICDHYTYLGSIFTADGSTSTAIKIHAQSKTCHALKFISFINKNCDIPFHIKAKVFHAAFVSTMLYGCESWLNGDMKPVHKLYMWCIKQLLGVRKTTCNDLCLIELDYPPLKALVMSRQRKFFSDVWRERGAMLDDPLSHAIRIVLRNTGPTAHFVRDLINENTDDVQVAMDNIKVKVRSSESNRMSMYLSVNPGLCGHEIYKNKTKINEWERVSWTRFRVSAHSLAVEKGRWSRRGRGHLPMEERLCSCGQVQSERHVVMECPRTQNIRQECNVSSFDNLLLERTDYVEVCSIIHRILNEYL